MGWNDQVDLRETEYLRCGAVSEWTYWNDTARARYSGAGG
jgi:hypothetical protein